jgi:glycosyltransferase involved in cell wall biosynthesis
MHSATVHIVTTLQEVRGSEFEAIGLRDALRACGAEVKLWSDTPSKLASSVGASVISPFTGQLPRSGTLVLIGTWLDVDAWITYAKPQRLILVSLVSDVLQLHRMHAQLQHAGLPPVEMAFISRRLQRTMDLPGIVCPTLLELENFHPREPANTGEQLVVGRHSRDVPEKHHPDDPSLYRLLAGQGWQVRLLGATCLQTELAGLSGTELMPVGAENPGDFLRSLDVFFYRTHPTWNEPSGRVVLEAMACGLPIVAHISGGYTDWIRHGENGLLFEDQEDAWLLLQQLRNEPALRERLGNAARESALGLAGPAARQAYLDWLLSHT